MVLLLKKFMAWTNEFLAMLWSLMSAASFPPAQLGLRTVGKDFFQLSKQVGPVDRERSKLNNVCTHNDVFARDSAVP